MRVRPADIQAGKSRGRLSSWVSGLAKIGSCRMSVRERGSRMRCLRNPCLFQVIKSLR